MSVDLAAKVVFFFDMRNIDEAILLFWHRFCFWNIRNLCSEIYKLNQL